MKKRIFVVSRFLKVTNNKNEFHFIGYFNGVRIKRIIVQGGEFDIGEDYVLALNNLRIKESILRGDLEKSKRLFI
jgi:hypothetical protein